MSLPCRLRSDHQINAPVVRNNTQIDALMRGADRTLNVIRDADSRDQIPLVRILSATQKPAPVSGFEHCAQISGEIAAVIGQACRGRVGQINARDEIAPAHVDAIDSQPARGDIKRALNGQRRLGPARAAKRTRRRRIGEHATHTHAGFRHAVNGGRDAVGIVQLHKGQRLRAKSAQNINAHGADHAICIEPRAHLRANVTTLIVGELRLRAVVGPFDRTLQFFRSPYDAYLLGIRVIARAKSTTCIRTHNTHVVGLQLQRAAHAMTHAVNALAAGVER